MGRFADLLGKRFVGKGRAVVDEVTVSFCRQGCIKGGSYSLSENVADLVMAKFRGPDSRALHAAVSWTPGG